MKKIILITFLTIFTLSASNAFAAGSDPKSDSDKLAIPAKTENKLSEEELSRLNKRVEEIRDMDKTTLATKERRELNKELKGIKNSVRDSGGVYIGVGTLILLIILLIILV